MENKKKKIAAVVGAGVALGLAALMMTSGPEKIKGQSLEEALATRGLMMPEGASDIVGMYISKPEDMTICEFFKDYDLKLSEGKIDVKVPTFPLTISMTCENGETCGKTFKSCEDFPPKIGLPCPCQEDMWIVKIVDQKKEDAE